VVGSSLRAVDPDERHPHRRVLPWLLLLLGLAHVRRVVRQGPVRIRPGGGERVGDRRRCGRADRHPAHRAHQRRAHRPPPRRRPAGRRGAVLSRRGRSAAARPAHGRRVGRGAAVLPRRGRHRRCQPAAGRRPPRHHPLATVGQSRGGPDRRPHRAGGSGPAAVRVPLDAAGRPRFVREGATARCGRARPHLPDHAGTAGACRRATSPRRPTHLPPRRRNRAGLRAAARGWSRPRRSVDRRAQRTPRRAPRSCSIPTP